MSIGGIADGPKLSLNLAGEVIGTDFGKVMYFDSASANVLSFDLVADLCLINWDQSKRQFFFCTEQGETFTFKRRGGLFVRDFSFLLEGQLPGIKPPAPRSTGHSSSGITQHFRSMRTPSTSPGT